MPDMEVWRIWGGAPQRKTVVFLFTPTLPECPELVNRGDPPQTHGRSRRKDKAGTPDKERQGALDSLQPLQPRP